MQRLILSLLLFLIGIPAYATWSIIVIDPKTGEIGIAGASCTYNCHGIGGIVPGKGGIIVQANSNKMARQKGMAMLVAGASPEQIIAELRKPVYDPERQQYAVVTLASPANPMTYTGDSTHHIRGALTASGISVQGNTLADSAAFKKILDAALAAQQEGLSISEVLIRALEAGAEAGGDRRCSSQRATTAFITVTRPTDRPNKPYLDLVIFGQAKGGQNAVQMLRKKYDKWQARHGDQ